MLWRQSKAEIKERRVCMIYSVGEITLQPSFEPRLEGETGRVISQCNGPKVRQ